MDVYFVKDSTTLRAQSRNEFIHTLEVTLFEDAGVVITTRKWFPDLGWTLADLVKATHMLRTEEDVLA